MKKTYLIPARSFIVFLFVLMAIIGHAQQPPAPTEYQIIHNSADPYLYLLDAFENQTRYVIKGDFAFRTALPAITIPSGPVLLEHVGVANPLVPAGLSQNNIFISRGYQRMPGESYVIFYAGVLQNGFAKNPDSVSTAFDIAFYQRPVEVVPADSVSFVFVNGVTDLARVDIQVPGKGTVVDNAVFAPKPTVSYPLPLKSFHLFAGNTTFILTDSSGATQIKAFVGDLSPYKGQSIALFTSGFLHPEENKNGASLGLFGALKNGTVIEFSTVITEVQAGIQNGISLLSNIAKDEIILSNSKAFSGNVNVEMYDLMGKQVPVLTRNADSNSLNISLSGMQEGTYLIKLKDGSLSANLKYCLTR